MGSLAVFDHTQGLFGPDYDLVELCEILSGPFRLPLGKWGERTWGTSSLLSKQLTGKFSTEIYVFSFGGIFP